ncbi:fimbrial protein [Cronobacter malonaticus]|uniref:Fimbrial protein n=2 Tax=Cronobacter malonaticus TaxID=413503 RepID=A0A423Y4M7_9ENTR|nr:type 1 fimbrial protein [Cronobacter malonaticus]ELY4600274.1 type 1 fimbrial protein [Cronobacter malonaticus]MDT3580819.1 type 1 fimbrial protein [Cronobacter malonaticus]ROW64816.1 fimbrial protein [Cronobacter malonaticus]RRA38910.1 fimbrial protein [Cronobacter malonaticus]
MRWSAFIVMLFFSLLSTTTHAACERRRGDDISVSSVHLPEHILVESGTYAQNTVLYDSGYISGSDDQVEIRNCNQGYYVGFLYLNAPQTGASLGEHIYPTNLEGIGVRVFTLNQAGPYDDETTIDNDWRRGDGSLFGSNHTLHGSAYRLQLVATGGKIGSGTLVLPSPLARVDFRERESQSSNGDIASQLNVSSTSVDVKAMGCTADTASLNFVMGNIDAAAFDNSVQVGEAQQTVTLSCEPGTNVTLEVQAPSASGPKAENSVIALSDHGAPDVATGVGVQLNLKLASGGYDSGKTGLPIGTPVPLLTSQRGYDGAQGYSYFTDPAHPGGAGASETLIFTVNYYKTGIQVTPGKANAAGMLTLSYN